MCVGGGDTAEPHCEWCVLSVCECVLSASECVCMGGREGGGGGETQLIMTQVS